MKQHGSEWHEWRGRGLGASDAPAVMGVSPWLTAYQLWEIKRGLAVHEPSEYATGRGKDLEEIARQHYTMHTGHEVRPATFTHPEMTFLRASLDGWNREISLVVEIKCVGQKNHDLAFRGQIPDYYYPQLQHQLFVTGSRKPAHYWSFFDNSGILVEVPRDDDYINDKLLPTEKEFWASVVAGKAPPLSDRDYKKVTSPEISELLLQYRIYKNTYEASKKQMDSLKEKIAALADHPRIECHGALIAKIHRQGSVDYKAIPELKSIDLDKFRKDPTEFWTIREKKK